jgi:hypothetical protein
MKCACAFTPRFTLVDPLPTFCGYPASDVNVALDTPREVHLEEFEFVLIRDARRGKRLRTRAARCHLATCYTDGLCLRTFEENICCELGRSPRHCCASGCLSVILDVFLICAT